MKPPCSFLSWKSQVQLCLEGRDLLLAGAKPPCPGRSSRWWYASQPCCLLAFQGNGVTEQLFFSQDPVFLSRHIHASATFAPYLQVLDEGSSDVQFCSTQKSLSCRLGVWKLPWVAADALNWSCGGFGVSHGCCIVRGPCSQLLLTPSAREKKGRGISVLTYVSFPKYSLPPFGPVYR